MDLSKHMPNDLHLAEVGHVLHEVAGAVGEGGGGEGEEADEEAGPRGHVGQHQVVDVEPRPRGEGQRHQEQQRDHHHHRQRLPAQQAGLDVGEAAGDHLDVPVEAGDGGDGDQDEVEAGPQPAVAEAEQRLVEDGDGGEPHVVPGDGAGEAGGDLAEAGAGVGRGAEQGEGEERGQQHPDRVGEQHHAAVPHQVVPVLRAAVLSRGAEYYLVVPCYTAPGRTGRRGRAGG